MMWFSFAYSNCLSSMPSALEVSMLEGTRAPAGLSSGSTMSAKEAQKLLSVWALKRGIIWSLEVPYLFPSEFLKSSPKYLTIRDPRYSLSVAAELESECSTDLHHLFFYPGEAILCYCLNFNIPQPKQRINTPAACHLYFFEFIFPLIKKL